MAETTNETTVTVDATQQQEPAEKTFTQAEVDEILKAQQGQFEEGLKKRLARETEKAKRQIEEAQKLAEMNEAEKAKYQLEELKKEVEAYKKKDAIAGLTRTARQMLSEGGINVSDDLLAMLVTDDAETTKAAVESFAGLFNAALENEIKNRFKGAPPKVGSASPLTRDQILAEPDRQKRQQMIQENLNLFK